MGLDNYIAYHVHSDMSLLDSCTQFNDYVDLAVELGQNALACTEHGRINEWFSKKRYAESKGIKFIHGVECYLTKSIDEKVRDNYHTILLARNYDGFLELNELLSKSWDKDDGHFYYANRITFDEFLGISDNIISTSACLASPLNKLDMSDPYYEKLIKKYTYLEIQAHDHPEQCDFNIHLATLASKYNKKLIAGTDTHNSSKYKEDCRRVLLKSKHQSYGDEDSFDLTYKSYDELVEMFRKQGVLPEKLFLQAIDNTNEMAEMCDEYEIDCSIKYPILYGSEEEDEKKYFEVIDTMFADKLDKAIIPEEQREEFKSRLAEEKQVLSKIGMNGFMLSMSELLTHFKSEGMRFGPSRGSVGGSAAAYVTDITDLNPVTWDTIFSRFCNEDRIEVGDIDIDCMESDRPKIFEYIINRFGRTKTARVPTYGTAASKEAIDIIGRALAQYWEEDHPDIDKNKNPYSLSMMAKIKKEFEKDEESTRKMYSELFYYYDGIAGTRISQSVHPAGMIISPVTLNDNYGTFLKDGEVVLTLDMDSAHDVGLVKYDFLILKNVQILSECCDLAGIEYPKSNEIDWGISEVWEDMRRSPVGIFQMNSDFAFKSMCTFKPKSIFDLSLVTAAIRPSGASYREDLFKKIEHHNPSKEIDDMLWDSYGYLIYQEQIIKFLQNICGLSGSEADTVRRGIAKKKLDELEKWMPKILEGYCEHASKPKEEAEEDAKAFLKIIEDASAYMFGYNHSVGYCLISYLCAYMRYYYPCEFIVSFLNNASNDDDVAGGTELARLYGVTIMAPKFGLAKEDYVIDHEKNLVVKGMSSIKFINKSIPQELYELAHSRKFEHFVDVLRAIGEHTHVDARQLDILIKVDYFDMFGNSAELSAINAMFEWLKKGEAKSIKDDNLTDDLREVIEKHAANIGVKGNKLKSYTITDMDGLLVDMELRIRNKHIEEYGYKLKMQWQNEYLGYVDLTTHRPEDRKKLFVTDIWALPDKFNGGIWKYNMNVKSIGTGNSCILSLPKYLYDNEPIKKGDIIRVEVRQDKKGYWNIYEIMLLE